MAQYRLNAYDADVWVSDFLGLNQADTGLTPDMRFAAEAENMETPNGVLQPQAACPLMDGSFDGPVETLAAFHRRWYEGQGSKDWYVCASGGKLYQKQAHTGIEWNEIEMPENVDAFQSNTWSWVTYEINPDNSQDTVDVLLMSNGLDGMIMVVPPDRPSTWGDWKEQDWSYLQDMTWMEATTPDWHIITIRTRELKFGVIERYAERVWGGAITGEPDMLMYSAVYDPTDWRLYTPDPDPEDPDQAEGQPEDGSGDILQPSWDGDRFYALRRFGDQLLAFKKNRVWRVLGVNPGEFTFQEQFGGGTEFFNTIAVDNDRVYMESREGLMVYDGATTRPLLQDNVKPIWKTVNRAAMDQMCAVLFRRRYYVAFPTGDSTVNNAMLAYDMSKGTILYYNSLRVESFLPTDDELYATLTDTPGRIAMIRYDSWEEGAASGAATRWVTPWLDFGYKRIQKGGFDLYFIPEVQTEPVTLTFSIQTEKKRKSKSYTVQPLTEEQREAQKEHRGKRLHFGGTGRK